ncbi:Protein of unknown function [Salipiger marinus]|uniref:DUF1403 family protein n=2 Tax=Salipiger marinus TaxID=555512 RepID=A0A1G8LU26_9RHOB|nr:Protein of unknown function [Salipiger marinus]
MLTDWRKAPLHARDLRMTPRGPRPVPQPPSLPPVPLRGASGAADTLEDHAFWSGAALAHLHLVLAQPDLPQPLLRDRLALRAAEASVAFQGRRESARELRDALHLLRPGDLPGPAGDSYQSWRRAVTRPISVAALHRALPDVAPDQLAVWLDAGQGGPVPRAALVLETVLAEAPRAEGAALILADAALAQALGWDHLLPLLAAGLTAGDLRKTGEPLRRACHRAVTASAQEAARLAQEVTRRAVRLRAVAPKLRAKRAGEAVALFLAHDALAPAALPLPDRAARRLCDRLVQLGAVRELTGRDSFRLYGL